ncbi:MAG: hypothetical protein EOO61_20065 [Hymenobacter sp.]|nr:MAG: hypothetical protein EOO61_20065 [Hymenobacter sp.]
MGKNKLWSFSLYIAARAQVRRRMVVVWRLTYSVLVTSARGQMTYSNNGTDGLSRHAART